MSTFHPMVSDHDGLVALGAIEEGKGRGEIGIVIVALALAFAWGRFIAALGIA